MQDIYEIMKKHGIEVEDEKKKDFEKDLFNNYKTVNEFNKLNSKFENLETENETLKTKHKEELKAKDESLGQLKEQLKEAGTEQEKLEELSKQIEDLQAQNETAKTNYEKDLIKQRKEFLIKEAVNDLKFTSNSAKELFIQKVTDKDLDVEDGKILGFNDFVNAYKETDAEAFVSEDEGDGDNKPKPHFGGKNQKVDDPEPGNDGDNGDEKPRPIIW